MTIRLPLLPALTVKRSVWFWTLCAFVSLVSMYDSWLLWQNESVILAVEENPVCRWLIEVNGGSVGLLIHWKAVGTTFVVLALTLLETWHRRWSLLITNSIASFQAGLLMYLMAG